MNVSPSHGGWDERASSAIAVKATVSPDAAPRKQAYQFHKLRSRDAFHVAQERPEDNLSPDERFARDYGDKGRNSTKTQAYRPLGTPDESIRQLPQLLRPGRRHFKSVNPAMTLGEMFGLNALLAASPITDDSSVKPSPNPKSLNIRRHYDHTHSGYVSLKAQIVASNQRKYRVAAGRTRMADVLPVIDPCVPSRADFERRWMEQRKNPIEPRLANSRSLDSLSSYLPLIDRRPRPAPHPVTSLEVAAMSPSQQTLSPSKNGTTSFSKLLDGFAGGAAAKSFHKKRRAKRQVRDPEEQIVKVCGKYSDAQTLLKRTLQESLTTLEAERQLILEDKRRFLDAMIHSPDTGGIARRQLPAMRMSVESERKKRHEDVAQQADWYNQLVAHVIERTKQDIAESDAHDPTQLVSGQQIFDSIEPAVRFMVDYVRYLCQVGRPLTIDLFADMIKQLTPTEFQSPRVGFVVSFLRDQLQIPDAQFVALLEAGMGWQYAMPTDS